MVVLFFGDIFGRPGRKAIAALLPGLKAQYVPDLILGNAENLAGGRGINRKTYSELMELGFHGFTSGNHIWDNKEVLSLFESGAPILRPANYPTSDKYPCPGKGFGVFKSGSHGLFVINLMGRIFMDSLDCPFAAVERVLEENKSEYPVLVDMHGEATSEKYAMAWHLAGRVAAVVGTHTHVQTADERILPGGTAYITDVGLTGSFDSVIGMNREEIVKKFVTKRQTPYQPARDNPGISCVVIQIGPDRKAQKIERLRLEVGKNLLGDERDLE